MLVFHSHSQSVSCIQFWKSFGFKGKFWKDPHASAVFLGFVVAEILVLKLFQRTLKALFENYTSFENYQGQGSWKKHPLNLICPWKANLCIILVRCLFLLMNLAEGVKIGNVPLIQPSSQRKSQTIFLWFLWQMDRLSLSYQYPKSIEISI